ncbi:protein FAR1-related sequence 11, partial [Tanacetum coccineum]
MSSRCGCKAYMRITYKRENEIFSEEWQVTILNLEHNHELLSTDEVRFLPSYHSITTEDEKRILLLKEGGLSIRQIMRVMELEKNVSSMGQLHFLVWEDCFDIPVVYLLSRWSRKEVTLPQEVFENSTSKNNDEVQIE